MMHYLQNASLFSNSPKKKQSEVFYIRSLREIQKHIRKHSPMYKICQSRIDELEKILKEAAAESMRNSSESSTSTKTASQNKKEATENATREVESELDIDIVGREIKMHANKYVEPLLEVCKSQKSKLVEIAIDTLHKLISNQFISMDLQQNSDPQSLINKVVQTICDTNHIDFQDENIQLQVIKTLLQAVTTYGVHGKNLRNIVKTCFNIQICSKNVDNQRAALATLTQILNATFQRIGKKDWNDFQRDIKRHFGKSLPPTVAKKYYEKYGIEKNFPRILSMIEADGVLQEDPNSIEESATQKISPPSEIIKKQSTEDVNLDEEHTLNDDDNSSIHSHSTSNTATIEALPTQNLDNHYQRDAYSIFKALCSMAKKVVIFHSFQEETQDSRSLYLSLDLIQIILESSSSQIKFNLSFLYGIQKHLFACLLKNCVSPIPAVTHYTLKIVGTVLKYYKEYLGRHMGIIISNAFLVSVESEYWSNEQKEHILKFLYSILDDTNVFSDIFVNLDCLPKSIPVFERIVETLANIIQQPETPSMTMDQELKKLSFSCLSTLVQRLYELKDVDDSKLVYPYIITEKEIGIMKKNGISLFNEKPEKGIQVLISDGILSNTPESKAHFLLNTPDLSKEKIGELLGLEKSQELLNTFAMLQKFSNMKFAIAFREFLSTFRLPGEGQQIDRFMKAFADSYYEQNPGMYFKSPSACHTFSFAVIMLHTELHSRSFINRDRMTVEEFIKNNEECNDDENFPEDFQREVYEDIRKKEIKIQEDTVNQEDSSLVRQKPKISENDFQNTLEYKRHMFDHEGKSIIRKTRKVLSEIREERTPYTNIYGAKLSKMMMGITWKRILVALASVFQFATDEETVETCINAFKQSIEVCANSKWILLVERDAFIGQIFGLCSISKNSNLITLAGKNVECVKLILKIAQTIPDLIGTSWKYVIELYSRLEEIHLGWTSKTIFSEYRTGGLEFHTLDRNLKYLFQVINLESIEHSFTRSGEFSDNSITTLVPAMIAVSNMELIPAIPRTYCMERLQVVIKGNTSRTSDVWKKIWGAFCSHFTMVACLPNKDIAMTAVISLYNLASSFLTKGEENLRVRDEILTPFMNIVKSSKTAEIRCLVIECIGNLIQLRYQEITNGWKLLIQILSEGAKDSYDPLVRHVHFSISLVFNEYMPYAHSAFIEIVNCIVNLAVSEHCSERSLVSIEQLESCANYLANGKLGTKDNEKDQPPSFSDNEEDMSLWWPILTGLANLINDERVLIRTKALEVLFQKVFKVYGNQFSRELWNLIFKGVIVPIFDDIQHTEDVDQHTEWITTSCHKALVLLVEVFSQYFEKIASDMLSPLLKLLQMCIRGESERLSNIGHECIFLLVTECWTKFSSEHWTLITSAYEEVLKTTDVSRNNSSLPPAHMKNNSRTQMNLCDDLVWILKSCNSLPIEFEKSFLNLLNITMKNCNQFSISKLNTSTAFQACQTEFLQLDHHVSKSYLEIIFYLHSDLSEMKDENHKKTINNLMSEVCQYVINLYKQECEYEKEEPGSQVHLLNSTSILAMLLDSIQKFEDEQFKSYIPTIEDELCDLICSDHARIRQSLRGIFSRIMSLSTFIAKA